MSYLISFLNEKVTRSYPACRTVVFCDILGLNRPVLLKFFYIFISGDWSQITNVQTSPLYITFNIFFDIPQKKCIFNIVEIFFVIIDPLEEIKFCVLLLY